ncbi:MAG: DUF4421 domain-containing protein [Tannerellaceae bacterium]|nr:DUF4421 domain-containing protein [Tannerellaceae bacterium]
MKYLNYILFFCLLTCCVYAQEDSLYIRTYPQDFTFRPYVYNKFTILSTEIKGQPEASFYPNIPVGVGIGFTYKSYALNLAYAPRFFRDKKKGKTTYIDFQYHYYGRRFLFDLLWQDYKGFYTVEDRKGELYNLHSDVHAVQYGVGGQYLFNYKKFSYRAAFYCDERQVRSAGSFQLGGGLYYNRLETETTPILEGRDRFRNYQLSITGGYVYSWIFKRNYFMTVGLAAGINLGLENVKNSAEKVEVTPNLFPRIAMGYNGDNWALFVNAVINRVYVTQSNNMDIIFDTGRANLMYVQRLNWSPPFLKKIKILNR